MGSSSWPRPVADAVVCKVARHVLSAQAVAWSQGWIEYTFASDTSCTKAEHVERIGIGWLKFQSDQKILRMLLLVPILHVAAIETR